MCDPAGPQKQNITPRALQCSVQSPGSGLLPRPAAAALAALPLCRRTFLRSLGAAALAFLTFPASWVQAKKIGIELQKAPELQQPGGTKLVRYKGLEILVVRDKKLGVHAINNTCTHKKCKVKYRTETDGLFCKCHKSAFALDGKVLAGPAPRPLTTYSAVMKQGRVIIDLP
jgi:nitrite reductase/ring-hydroxylating ferredoxin subunit